MTVADGAGMATGAPEARGGMGNSDGGGEEAGFGARCRARRSHDVEPWEDAASEAGASSGSEGGGGMRHRGRKENPKKEKRKRCQLGVPYID